MNVVKPAQTEWALPIFFVSKNDRTLHYCVDYRKLNAVTTRGSYALLQMDESIDSLGYTKILCTLDGNSGY